MEEKTMGISSSVSNKILDFTGKLNIAMISLLYDASTQIKISNPKYYDEFISLVAGDLNTSMVAFLESLHTIEELVVRAEISSLPEDMREGAAQLERDKRDQYNNMLEQIEKELKKNVDGEQQEEEGSE